jgi:hypothetical protein
VVNVTDPYGRNLGFLDTGDAEFLATDPEVRVRFPGTTKKKAVGLERGPLSLVSTAEELFDRKVAAPV